MKCKVCGREIYDDGSYLAEMCRYCLDTKLWNKAIDEFAEEMRKICNGIAIAQKQIDETVEKLKR